MTESQHIDYFKKAGLMVLLFSFSVLLGFSTTFGASPEGKLIYDEHCGKCHGGGFIGWLSGAPEVGEVDDWKTRLTKSVDEIKASTVKGIGRMDPKGGCKECSEDEVGAAVDYMLSALP